MVYKDYATAENERTNPDEVDEENGYSLDHPVPCHVNERNVCPNDNRTRAAIRYRAKEEQRRPVDVAVGAPPRSTYSAFQVAISGDRSLVFSVAVIDLIDDFNSVTVARCSPSVSGNLLVLV